MATRQHLATVTLSALISLTVTELRLESKNKLYEDELAVRLAANNVIRGLTPDELEAVYIERQRQGDGFLEAPKAGERMLRRCIAESIKTIKKHPPGTQIS